MMKKNEQINKEVDPNDLTEVQDKNWISWADVKKQYDELEKKVDEFYKEK
jgi:isopentenyldiphosphate isomerase